jgi:hypothetical protein
MEEWQGGVFLCSASGSLEADILESKLRSEGIPCGRRYGGAGNFLEIFMGTNSTCPIDIYVPAAVIEDARNIILAFPLDDSGGREDRGEDKVEDGGGDGFAGPVEDEDGDDAEDRGEYGDDDDAEDRGRDGDGPTVRND